MKTIFTIIILAMGFVTLAEKIEIPKGAEFKLISIKEGPVVTVEMVWTPKKKIEREKKTIELNFSDTIAQTNMKGAIEFFKKSLNKNKFTIKNVDRTHESDELNSIHKEIWDKTREEVISFTYLKNNYVMIFLSDGSRLDELYAKWLVDEYNKGKKQEKEYNDKLQSGKL